MGQGALISLRESDLVPMLILKKTNKLRNKHKKNNNNTDQDCICKQLLIGWVLSPRHPLVAFVFLNVALSAYSQMLFHATYKNKYLCSGHVIIAH